MTGAGRVLSSFAALVYVLILAPIVVVVMLAFSADNFILFPPSGYSLRWFNQLARDGTPRQTVIPVRVLYHLLLALAEWERVRVG